MKAKATTRMRPGGRNSITSAQKVAAVATLCQDRRVFDAMWNAGTPCPFEGKIGEQAKTAWIENPDRVPKKDVPTAETVN